VTATEVVVGRQPIFDSHGSVFGYELLFRTLTGPTAAEAAGSLGDQMTADVIFNSLNIGIDRLVGTKKVFCNASRGVLTGVVPILLPAQQTVIEIVQSLLPQEDMLAGCLRLHEEGFSLALDGISGMGDFERLAALVSFVKIDLRATNPESLQSLVEHCRNLGTIVVAQKVETVEEFNRCVDLGFDYFQGYLLARPTQVAGRALDPGRVAQLRLAARLLDQECPISELEDIVRRDPVMTLQVLQLATIGGVGGMRRTVRTIREALLLVGWRRLQSWVSLLLVGGKGQASEEELTVALARARTCELVADAVDRSLSPAAFTAGMIASFDVLLGMPLEEVLRYLPIDDHLRSAILESEGPLGQLLADVADFQLGRPEESTRSGLEDPVISSAALDGLLWAVEMTSAIPAVT